MNNKSVPTAHVILLILSLIAAGTVFYLTQRQMALVNRLSAEVDLISKNRGKLTLLSDNLPGVEGDVSVWQKTLPGTVDEVAAFADEVGTAARAQGLIYALDFDDFPGPVDVGGKYIDGLGAGITLEGTYAGVVGFMTRMSTLPNFFKVDKLSLSSHESGKGVKAVINGALMMDILKTK